MQSTMWSCPPLTYRPAARSTNRPSTGSSTSTDRSTPASGRRLAMARWAVWMAPPGRSAALRWSALLRRSGCHRQGCAGGGRQNRQGAVRVSRRSAVPLHRPQRDGNGRLFDLLTSAAVDARARRGVCCCQVPAGRRLLNDRLLLRDRPLLRDRRLLRDRLLLLDLWLAGVSAQRNDDGRRNPGVMRD